MCTSIAFKNKDFYFGRNLDLEYSFSEKVIITPRNYEFQWRNNSSSKQHYAMIGMATVANNYPLYAEGANEKGLCMAGLNFPSIAKYLDPKEGMHNVTPFEFIPWLLGQCATVEEAKKLLVNTNLTNIQFNEYYPLAPLHWMISDENSSIVVEPMEDGLHIFDNPYHVLTNNPPFDYHKWNINNYMTISPLPAQNAFRKELPLKTYGQGMGSIGLPGDVSPASRFVRAAFALNNAVAEENEEANITQFFHILDNVAMVRGCAITPEGKYDITTYSCCINANTGVYYYKTYGNNQLNAVSLHNVDINSSDLFIYELVDTQQINQIN